MTNENIERLQYCLPPELLTVRRFIPVQATYDKAKSKWTKRPLCKWGDSSHWLSFDEMMRTYGQRQDVFCGLAVQQTDDIRVLDLDHVIEDRQTVEDIRPELKVLFYIRGYAEYSISCGGLHVLCRNMFGNLRKSYRFLNEDGTQKPWGIDILGQGSLSVCTLSGYACCQTFEICEDQRLARMVARIVERFETKAETSPCAKQWAANWPPVQTSASIPGNRRAYLEGILRRQLDAARADIQGASVGARNETILRRSRLLGGYWAGGLHAVVSESSLAQALLAMSGDYVADDGENAAKATIESGLRYGAQYPVKIA